MYINYLESPQEFCLFSLIDLFIISDFFFFTVTMNHVLSKQILNACYMQGINHTFFKDLFI